MREDREHCGLGEPPAIVPVVETLGVAAALLWLLLVVNASPAVNLSPDCLPSKSVLPSSV